MTRVYQWAYRRGFCDGVQSVQGGKDGNESARFMRTHEARAAYSDGIAAGRKRAQEMADG